MTTCEVVSKLSVPRTFCGWESDAYVLAMSENRHLDTYLDCQIKSPDAYFEI